MRATPDPLRTIQSRPRSAHLVLLDGAEIDGGLYLNDGQALAPYLGSRKGGWLNLVGARRVNDDTILGHAVIQAAQILMAWSPGSEIAMAGAIANSVPREVEIVLRNDVRLHGMLLLGERQRMSDFLYTCGAFVPVIEAKRLPEGGEVRDIALNSAEVRLVRDTKVFTPSAAAAAAAAEATTPPGGVTPTGGAPAVTRSGPAGRATTARQPAGMATSGGIRRQPRLSGHWLVQLATKAALEKPDAKAVEGDLSVQRVWRALAEKNDMADGELAAHVAASFHLPIAHLDAATPEALAIVPEDIARALGILPLRVEDRQLVLAASDPSETQIVRHLLTLTKLRLEYEIATPKDIQGAIDWYYGAHTG